MVSVSENVTTSICPKAWRLPSKTDYSSLIAAIGANSNSFRSIPNNFVISGKSSFTGNTDNLYVLTGQRLHYSGYMTSITKSGEPASLHIFERLVVSEKEVKTHAGNIYGSYSLYNGDGRKSEETYTIRCMMD